MLNVPSYSQLFIILTTYNEFVVIQTSARHDVSENVTNGFRRLMKFFLDLQDRIFSVCDTHRKKMRKLTAL